MSMSEKHLAVVLAAACNAGKSSIVIHIINLFLKSNPSLKVIIFAHNQNILRDQMLEGFSSGFVKPDFTFGEFGSNSQVEVGIPSSRAKIKACDLLVIDEAHQYVGCAMVNSVLAKFNPKYKVFMTGSHGCYNKANQDAGYNLYGIHYISGHELAEKDVYSDVVVDAIEGGTNVIQNYTKAIAKLKSDNRFDDKKLMIACKTVNDAYILGIYVKRLGRKIAISTSGNDTDNIQIKRFKSGEADTLIVVNKGILGFSDDMVTGLIDLKGSKDLDSKNQLFGRILRKHPESIKKFYISVVSKKELSNEIKLLYSVVGLMNPEIFKTYI
jgi:superfamily II DNA or RNA helicase